VFGYAAFAQPPFAALGESAMPVALADTATISDSQTVINSFGGLFDDTATLSDSVNAAATYYVYIADTATGSDTFAAALTYNVGIADTATISDTPSVVATIVASVTGIQLYVYVGSTLVWAVVDDTQNANWQNINDTQTPGWVNIPT
jgi:hypothetical protein